MLRPGTRWELRRRDDGTPVARLSLASADFPWIICALERTAGFAEAERLMADMHAAWDAGRDDVGDALYEEVNRLLRLVAPEGGWPDADEFLMRVEGPSASFRTIPPA